MQSFYPKLLLKTIALLFCYIIYFYYSHNLMLLITETFLLSHQEKLTCTDSPETK